MFSSFITLYASLQELFFVSFARDTISCTVEKALRDWLIVSSGTFTPSEWRISAFQLFKSDVHNIYDISVWITSCSYRSNEVRKLKEKELHSQNFRTPCNRCLVFTSTIKFSTIFKYRGNVREIVLLWYYCWCQRGWFECFRNWWSSGIFMQLSL